MLPFIYLATSVADLADGLKNAIVAGAAAGGGLTVISLDTASPKGKLRYSISTINLYNFVS